MATETKKKKAVPPQVHRVEKEFFVCDPDKADRTDELESWRVFKMMAELIDGFELLRKYKLAATFFGTARQSFDPKVYADAEELAKRLGESGFAIVTGGAAGVMEAANKGAHEAKAQSIGLNIRLPHEQEENKYTNDFMFFDYFFTRKVMLTFASEIYFFFPGGFGTLSEFLDILTLVQTNKIKRIPMVLYGKAHWTPLIKYFKEELYEKSHAISKEDLDLFYLVDSPEEAYNLTLKVVDC